MEPLHEARLLEARLHLIAIGEVCLTVICVMLTCDRTWQANEANHIRPKYGSPWFGVFCLPWLVVVRFFATASV